MRKMEKRGRTLDLDINDQMAAYREASTMESWVSMLEVASARCSMLSTVIAYSTTCNTAQSSSSLKSGSSR